MILYNVTIHVEPEIEQDWLIWMKNVHIPEVLQTGCFAEHKFLRLLNEAPEATGITYAVQYFTTGVDRLEQYLNEFAPELRQKQHDRYENRLIAFRTFLEEV